MEPKPGQRSTEFWLAGLIATMIGGFGLGVAAPDMTYPEAIVRAAAILGVSVIVRAYIGARSQIKAGAQ